MGSPFGDPSLGPGWGQGATNFAQQLWQSQNPGQPAGSSPYYGAGAPGAPMQPAGLTSGAPQSAPSPVTDADMQRWGITNGPQNPYQTNATTSLWYRLSKALGQGGGLQSAAANLQNAFKPPTPMGPATTQAPLPQGQMPTPPGMASYFQKWAEPSSPNNMQSQIAALQQLMGRG